MFCALDVMTLAITLLIVVLLFVFVVNSVKHATLDCHLHLMPKPTATMYGFMLR
jgi:hypothetical protein